MLVQAHLLATGMGPVYDGLLHFALSPEDSLPVVVLGVFAGLRGPATARAVAGALPAGWLAGGAIVVAGVGPPSLALAAATAVLFMIVGGALASNARPPAALTALAAGVLGLVRGAADAAGLTASVAHALTLAGISASVFVAVALAASLTLPLRRQWLVIVARVAGSWLAALGLLLAGWILRYGDRAL